jgi:tRNA nucleotidyltransferase (CCA-adding enzyme)
MWSALLLLTAVAASPTKPHMEKLEKEVNKWLKEDSLLATRKQPKEWEAMAVKLKDAHNHMVSLKDPDHVHDIFHDQMVERTEEDFNEDVEMLKEERSQALKRDWLRERMKAIRDIHDL